MRALFRLYLVLGTVTKLQVEANRLGLRTKRRVRSHGDVIGGKPFTRGHLYQLLQNPLYAGQIIHKGEVFAGKHRAIIDRHTFEQVRQRLADNTRQRRSKTNVDAPSLLTGRAFDETGDRFCPTHTKNNGRRYRYYVSHRLGHRTDKAANGWRLPAAPLEELVGKSIARFLEDEGRLIDGLGLKGVTTGCLAAVIKEAKSLAGQTDQQIGALQKVTVKPTELVLDLSRPALLKQLNLQETTNLPKDVGSIKITMPINLKRRGVESKLVVRARQGEQVTLDPDLLTLLGQAQNWFGKVQSGEGKSARALALELGVDPADFGRTILLVFLAPDITEAILADQQPTELTPRRLKRVGTLPLDWADQRHFLGFPAR